MEHRCIAFWFSNGCNCAPSLFCTQCLARRFVANRRVGLAYKARHLLTGKTAVIRRVPVLTGDNRSPRDWHQSIRRLATSTVLSPPARRARHQHRNHFVNRPVTGARGHCSLLNHPASVRRAGFAHGLANGFSIQFLAQQVMQLVSVASTVISAPPITPAWARGYRWHNHPCSLYRTYIVSG